MCVYVSKCAARRVLRFLTSETYGDKVKYERTKKISGLNTHLDFCLCLYMHVYMFVCKNTIQSHLKYMHVRLFWKTLKFLSGGVKNGKSVYVYF